MSTRPYLLANVSTSIIDRRQLSPSLWSGVTSARVVPLILSNADALMLHGRHDMSPVLCKYPTDRMRIWTSKTYYKSGSCMNWAALDGAYIC
jgi:hypothetical protein